MTLLFLLLGYAAIVDSVCSPNYALVPVDAFIAFIEPTAAFFEPLETTFQTQLVTHCAVLAQACYASYTNTVQSVFTLSQFRVSDRSPLNQSVALLTGYRNCFRIMHPDIAPQLETLFGSLGLDLTCSASATDYLSDPQSNCQGVTNAFLTFAKNDGWNNFGDLNRKNQPQVYNKIAYTDYTNRFPVNPAGWPLKDKNRYQPHVDNYWTSAHHPSQANSASGNWYFDYETPQIRWAKGYGFSSVTPFKNQFPPVLANYYASPSSLAKQTYNNQATDILARSAALTDVLKLKTEYFNDKVELITSVVVAPFLAGYPGPISQIPFSLIPGTNTPLPSWTQDDFMFLVPGLDAAGYNGLILAFAGKYYFDSIRPVTVIQNVINATTVSSWGGTCVGQVNNMPPSNWQSYLRTMQHPEYPSATTCICASIAQYMRRVWNIGDTMPAPITVTNLAGSSTREPGCVPAVDTSFTYTTWSQWETECGESRLNAGVHFASAVSASHTVCPQLGNITYDYFKSFWNGTATTAINPLDRDIFSPSDDGDDNQGGNQNNQ